MLLRLKLQPSLAFLKFQAKLLEESVENVRWRWGGVSAGDLRLNGGESQMDFIDAIESGPVSQPRDRRAGTVFADGPGDERAQAASEFRQ